MTIVGVALLILLFLALTAGPVLLVLALMRWDARRERRLGVAQFDAFCDAQERILRARRTVQVPTGPVKYA